MNKKFAEDVILGLSSSPKNLPEKYFFNKEGERLFRAIMGLSEYYLTDAEFEIFYANKGRILKYFRPNEEPFNLIEFGARDALKTKVLLRYFLDEKIDFTYMPVDLSKDSLESLRKDLSFTFPDLKLKTINKEFLNAFDNINKAKPVRNIILFLGADIGNFTLEEAKNFFSVLKGKLNPNDVVVTGFDLKKDPAKILRAYSDKFGIYSDFNLNLLSRINEEFNADFNLSAFHHYASYDPIIGEVKNYLISKYAQTVHIEKLNKTFEFEYSEPVFMEISKKYDQETVEKMAIDAGYEIVEHFIDGQRYFLDAFWKV